jgi:hypothetical protein
LDWINPLNPFSPAEYHVTTVREMSSGGVLREYHPVAYYGSYSPLWWSVWLVVPMGLIEIVRNFSEVEEQGIGLFTFSWVAASFLPYVLLAHVLKRWVYPFYFYASLPGLYIGLSHYADGSRLRKTLLSLLMLTQLEGRYRPSTFVRFASLGPERARITYLPIIGPVLLLEALNRQITTIRAIEVNINRKTL